MIKEILEAALSEGLSQHLDREIIVINYLNITI